MNIPIVSSQFPPRHIGGHAIYTYHICRILAKRGHQVHLFLRDTAPCEYASLAEKLGIKLHVISTKGWISPVAKWRACRQFVCEIQKIGAKGVFFAYPVTGWGKLYQALDRANLPFVLSLHSYHEKYFQNQKKWKKIQKRWGIPFASAFVTCSQWLKEVLQPYLPFPPKVIPLGADADFQSFSSEQISELRNRLGLEGKTVLLCVSRLAPSKNLQGLLEIFAKLVSRCPQVCLLVVGGGEEEQNLKKRAKELGIDKQVIWHPPVPHWQVSQFYELADLFVLLPLPDPSKGQVETFGLVYIEASLFGLPVIGSRVGGIPEAIKDKVTGFLVNPEDRRDIVEKLLYLVQNPEVRRKMGQAGKEWVKKHFSWEKTGEKLEKVLQEAFDREP